MAATGSLVICLIGGTLLAVAAIARGPDFDLEFHRELKTDATAEQVDAVLRDLKEWPRWFHSLAEARVVGQAGSATPTAVHAGEDLALDIDPHKGPGRRFTLFAHVDEYQPGKRISLHVTSDSQGKITRLFDELHWVVEVGQDSGGRLIQGEGTARTRHWRSRFFGRLADQILMNQIFYPDLFKLAKIDQPVDTSLPPVD
jgi:hypothetical protein